MLLKCYQLCESDTSLLRYMRIIFIDIILYMVAELADDKRTHRKLFTGEIEFERFYRYLRYASVNTFMHLVAVFEDKIIELLEDDDQEDAADWFAGAMTKKEGHWMLERGARHCDEQMRSFWQGRTS